MKTYRPQDAEYTEFVASLNRRALPDHSVSDIVTGIIAEVAEKGDAALCAYAEKFDKVSLIPADLFVTEEEKEEARRLVSDDTKAAIAASKENIHAFARHSMRKDWTALNAQGAEVGERFLPFSRVGIYIPGGKAPLCSTSLMTGAFAQAVGVPEIVAASPCGLDGKLNPALLYALLEAGATEIIKVGGAQAIAALSLGTESIRPVDKVFGPGNKFVVEAKRQLVGAVAIDLLPGPSEVMVLADDSANPAFVAADLLAQAEHGGDSIAGFVTTSESLLRAVEVEIERQAALLSRAEILKDSLNRGAFCLLVDSLDEGIAVVNAFAPEHLCLFVDKSVEEKALQSVLTAGAIYVGNYSAVAVGDFLAGPSHTLPTGGAGKSFSGLRADQFQRRTSIVRIDPKAAKLSAPIVAEFARIEGLDAHGRSAALRAETDTAPSANADTKPSAE